MPSLVQQAISQRNRGGRARRIPRSRTNLSAPRSLERKLERAMVSLIDKIADDLRRRLIPRLPEFVNENAALNPRKNSDSTTYHEDVSVARRLAELIAATQVSLQGTLSPAAVEAEIRDLGVELSTKNQALIQTAFKTALGVELFQNEPFIEGAIGNYVGETSALVQNASREFISQTERVVLQGMRQGLRHEEIAKQILGSGTDAAGKASRFTVAKNRVKLIARDQMNKLNGKLTELRQTNAGISEYIWRTVGDDRVRPQHRDLNGKKFSWDQPPSEGHPGEPINCRCYAEPVFDV